MRAEQTKLRPATRRRGQTGPQCQVAHSSVARPLRRYWWSITKGNQVPERGKRAKIAQPLLEAHPGNTTFRVLVSLQHFQRRDKISLSFTQGSFRTGTYR